MSLIEGIDYYLDPNSGLIVLTSEYHKKRGYCCGNGCKECPYDPKAQRGNTKLKKRVDDSLKN